MRIRTRNQEGTDGRREEDKMGEEKTGDERKN